MDSYLKGIHVNSMRIKTVESSPTTLSTICSKCKPGVYFVKIMAMNDNWNEEGWGEAL